jgi:hypothetical protein
MAPGWDKVNALVGGTDAMRAAGKKYLPMWSEELPEQYAARVERSFLFEFFTTTTEKMASKPFRQPLAWEPSDPQLKERIEEDVDMQGNNLDVFASRLLLTALRKGMAHVMLDWSGTTAEKTLAERKAAGARVFLREFQPDTVLECRCERVNGQEVVTRLRVRGYEVKTGVVRDDPYREVVYETVTVFEPETITEFSRAMPQKKGAKLDPWSDPVIKPNPMGAVHFHTFYAKRSGHMTSDLPLSGVIDKNLEHWQSSSNQRVALDVARFPMLAAKGISQKELDAVSLGPLAMLAAANPQGEFYYVENEGKALEAGRKDLEDIKADMAALVADFYASSGPASRATATEAAGKGAEGTAPIQLLCENFSDFLEAVMYSAAEIEELKPEQVVGDIDINDDYSMDPNMAKVLESLSSARERGDLSQEEWVWEMKRRRILDPKREYEGGDPPATMVQTPPAPGAPASTPPAAAGDDQ